MSGNAERTARCGPACRVVWEGSGQAWPLPDSMRRREATNASRASTRRAAAEASRRPYVSRTPIEPPWTRAPPGEGATPGGRDSATALHPEQPRRRRDCCRRKGDHGGQPSTRQSSGSRARDADRSSRAQRQDPGATDGWVRLWDHRAGGPERRHRFRKTRRWRSIGLPRGNRP